MKRRIDIKSIRGITVSKISDEFVVHGMDVEYDYYFLSPRKMLICEAVAIVFKKETNKDLMFAETSQKDLGFAVTSKKDKKSDPTFSKMPTVGLFTITKKDGTKSATPTPTQKTQNPSQAPNTNKSSAVTANVNTSKPVIGDAKFEDFKVLKVLGRGTFGKVCLVQNNKNNLLYAMKSIKKDVLIDLDQIENTLQEKTILQNLKHPFLVDLKYCFQNDERIFFVMPFLKGGELFQHLRKVRLFDENK